MDIKNQKVKNEPERITPELYKELLSTVIKEHLQKIDIELYQLQSDILSRVKITEYGKGELSKFTFTTTTGLTETIKNILWS